MKIYVDTLPENPNQCCFALLTQYKYDPKLIPNCQLKCNTFPAVDGHSFSYVPGRFTCSLAGREKCPYLLKKE